MAQLFGFGIGVLIISTVWALSVLLCLIFSRRRGLQNGFPYIVLAIYCKNYAIKIIFYTNILRIVEVFTRNYSKSP
uniref:Uncharacterized protein n=1 Tax=Panagrolaimus sp. JU765 TaxID=591449 RepID=A0AC34RE56_9BILA